MIKRDLRPVMNRRTPSGDYQGGRMKHEHDGWLYVIDGEHLVYQTVEHARAYGEHKEYLEKFRVRNDWDYTRALEIAGRMYEDATT